MAPYKFVVLLLLLLLLLLSLSFSYLAPTVRNDLPLDTIFNGFLDPAVSIVLSSIVSY